MNIGDVIGKWTLLKEERKDRRIAWLARCECGREKTVMERYMLNGRSVSCGCSKRGKTYVSIKEKTDTDIDTDIDTDTDTDKDIKPKKIIIPSYKYSIGDIVGDVEILDMYYKKDEAVNKNRCYYYIKCACGNSKEIRADIFCRLKNKNCGCNILPVYHNHKYRSDLTKEENVDWQRLYFIHDAMYRRCYDEKCKAYINYGARGITMCDEWRVNFKPFYDWALSSGYKNNLTIDRIDNDGNYSPQNCQWLTKRDNTRKRRNVRLTVETAREIKERIKNGEKQRDLAMEYDVRESQISRVKHGTRWTE